MPADGPGMPVGTPLVSVILPALDEAADIAGCIDAVAAQDLALEEIELLVVDGVSSDSTVAVAERAAADRGFASVRVLTNERRRTSASLNIGLAEARGTYVVRVDARSRIPREYITTCVEVLETRPEVGVCGGAQRPRARSPRLVDRGIARALGNRYATGMSRYRRSRTSGPADTVWMGVFRRRDLVELGGWPEAVALNEDWALNQLYRDRGQQIWFAAELESDYLPRTDLPKLARQYFYFGRVKGLWWMRGSRPEPRQLALVAGPPLAGVALLGLTRRRPALAVVAPVALLLVDAAGSSPRVGLPERLAASIAIATIGATWWAGVVAGAAGEVMGVEHVHRSLPS